MSSETEDSDRALKPGPHSNLLHPERTNTSNEAAEERGKSNVMDRDTLKELEHNAMVRRVLHAEFQRALFVRPLVAAVEHKLEQE